MPPANLPIETCVHICFQNIASAISLIKLIGIHLISMNSLMNKKIGTYGHDLYKNMVGNIYTRQCYISPTIKEI